MNLTPLNSLIRQRRQSLAAMVEGGKEYEMGHSQFAASFRILNFNLGRGAGHSTYIAEDFAEGEDIAIVPRANVEAFAGAAGVFTSLRQALDYMSHKGKRVRDIWIDEPTHILKTKADVDELSMLIKVWRNINTRPGGFADGLMIFMGQHMV